MTPRNPTDDLKDATVRIIHDVKQQYFQYLADHKDILSRSELKQKDRIDISAISIADDICNIDIPDIVREWGRTNKDRIFDLLLPEAVIQITKNKYLRYKTEPTTAKSTLQIKSWAYEYEEGIWEQLPYITYRIDTRQSELYAMEQNFNKYETTKNIANLWEIQDLDEFYYKYTQKDLGWTKTNWSLFKLMVEFNKKTSKEGREKYGTILYLDTIFLTNLYLRYFISENHVTELPKAKDRYIYQIELVRLRTETPLSITDTPETKEQPTLNENKDEPIPKAKPTAKERPYGHFRVYKDGRKIWIPEKQRHTRK